MSDEKGKVKAGASRGAAQKRRAGGSSLASSGSASGGKHESSVTLKAAELYKVVYHIVFEAPQSAEGVYVPESDEFVDDEEGWGDKHGYGKLNSWARRYFHLNSSRLTYSKVKGAKPRGTIALSCLCSCRKVNAGDERHPDAAADSHKGSNRWVKRENGVLLIVPERRRAFEWFCDSENERNRWWKAISHNLELMLAHEDNIRSMTSLFLDLSKKPQVAGMAKQLLRHRHLPPMVSRSEPMSDDPVLVHLRYLTRHGKLQQIKELIEQHVKGESLDFNIDEPGPVHGCTLLHIATHFQEAEILKWFLGCGANANVEDELGETALLYAARLGDRACLKALMDFGALYDVENKFHETARSEAVLLKHSKHLLRDLDAYAKKRSTISQLLSLNDTMRCGRCKTLIPKGSKFCLLCGHGQDSGDGVLPLALRRGGGGEKRAAEGAVGAGLEFAPPPASTVASVESIPKEEDVVVRAEGPVVGSSPATGLLKIPDLATCDPPPAAPCDPPS